MHTSDSRGAKLPQTKVKGDKCLKINSTKFSLLKCVECSVGAEPGRVSEGAEPVSPQAQGRAGGRGKALGKEGVMKESDPRGGGGVEAGSVVSADLPRYEVCGVPPACAVPAARINIRRTEKECMCKCK